MSENEIERDETEPADGLVEDLEVNDEAEEVVGGLTTGTIHIGGGGGPGG